MISRLLNKGTGLKRIYSTGEFYRHLFIEKARSLRSGNNFCVLIFKSTQYNEFSEVLLNRVRIYDQVGWLGGNRLGLILLSENIEGINSFLTSLKNDCGWHGVLFKLESKLTSFTDLSAWEKEEFSQEPGFLFSPLNGVIPVNTIYWKRCVDIIFSLGIILLIWPILLFLAVYIKFVSPNGNVLFRQDRVGLGGKIFTLYKFRTMHPENIIDEHKDYFKNLIDEGDTPMTKQEPSDRIITGGKILRITALDELPQLFNILLGDMSLVGPRPCIPYEAKEYLDWNLSRFDCAPGLTGLWQVSGKNRLTFSQMMRLDIQYSRNISFMLDMKILLATPRAVYRQIKDTIK